MFGSSDFVCAQPPHARASRHATPCLRVTCCRVPNMELSRDLPALMEDEEEEELEDVPDAEKKADALFNACIKRTVDGIEFEGQVEDIEIGKISRERLYRIKYTDGDLEHLTEDMVKKLRYIPNTLGDDDAEGGATKKKPAAAKAAPKAKGKAKAKAAPKAKAKAKGKAKAKAKGRASK